MGCWGLISIVSGAITALKSDQTIKSNSRFLSIKFSFLKITSDIKNSIFMNFKERGTLDVTGIKYRI